MRQFLNFPEAQNEVKRDLAELGTKVHPETMQHFAVAEDENFATMELYNYGYTVLNPHHTEVEGIHEDWVMQEWQDRVTGDLNPGRAWKKRRELWEDLLEKDGSPNETRWRFAYTYSQRMGGEKIEYIINELRTHPHSRQLWLPVWYPIDATRRGRRRVPCSLGYWFVYRNKRLHMTYNMRSCDFATHYPNDICLATLLLYHVADAVGMEVGTFTHMIGSLHVYAKDVKDVF